VDRARGYATSQSFFERGVSAVAAPVRDKHGAVIAALNVTAVDAHVTLDDMRGYLKDEVLKASSEITQWIVADGPQGRATTKMPPRD
jgi:IclR family pca regulon transcriptional regulator